MRTVRIAAAASVSLVLLAGCEPAAPAPAEPAISPMTTPAGEGEPSPTAAGTPAATVPPAGGDPAEETATEPSSETSAAPVQSAHDDVSQADLENSLKKTWRLESITLASKGEGAYEGTGVGTEGVNYTFGLKPEQNGYRLEVTGSDGSGGNMYMAKPQPAP